MQLCFVTFVFVALRLIVLSLSDEEMRSDGAAHDRHVTVRNLHEIKQKTDHYRQVYTTGDHVYNRHQSIIN